MSAGLTPIASAHESVRTVMSWSTGPDAEGLSGRMLEAFGWSSQAGHRMEGRAMIEGKAGDRLIIP
jgi:hypothetical protein